MQKKLDEAKLKLEEELNRSKSLFVSVTGLRLKRFWLVPIFYRYAIPSFSQATRAKGNLFTQVATVDGVQHTLTIWRHKRDIKKFSYSGIHKKAIAMFHKIATGSTLTYEVTSIPSWNEVLEKWHNEAIEY